METIGNKFDKVSVSQATIFDLSTCDHVTWPSQNSSDSEKNTREPMQLVRARKPHLLIVDEEWW